MTRHTVTAITGKKNGGITVSGGEALLQIDFVIELFKLAKEKGVHTTLDTSGNPFTREEPFFSKFNELMKVTDLFMLDIKQIDDEKHKKLTGWTNSNILDLAQYLSDNGKAMWIRHVLVPGITTDDADLEKLRDFVGSLKTVERFEILPYHTLGVFKWENLGIPYEHWRCNAADKRGDCTCRRNPAYCRLQGLRKIKCRINAGWIKNR